MRAAVQHRPVAEACAHLGIEGVVEIELARLYSIAGYYRREDDYHLIVVNEELSPGEMSKTVYHELEHARQCEQEFGGDAEAYHQATLVAAQTSWSEPGVILSPFERLAREAEKLDDQVRLAEWDDVGFA